MKVILVFAITISTSFWAADLFCFDGEYSAKIWKQANQLGAVWQHDARLWFKHQGFQTAQH
jgi:hypothetical protein